MARSVSRKTWEVIDDQEAIRLENELIDQIKKLEQQSQCLKERTDGLEMYASIEKVPDWAKSSVEKAVQNKLIDSPNGGSIDFYRLITILGRMKKL